jgi:hypothetical protein
MTMKKRMKWIYMIAGGLLTVGLAVGAGFVYLRSEAAERRTLGSINSRASGLYTGWLGDEDRPMGKYEEALAEALGISIEELQEALDTIREATIQTAIEAGDLTQDQADQLLDLDGSPLRGRRRSIGIGSEVNELLANELGISTTALEAAQEKAQDAMFAAAIEAGDLSETQAELMRANRAMEPYLQAAMTEAFENAVEQALSEGAITQAQADLLLENGGPGSRGIGIFPGKPGKLGRGDFFPGEQLFRPDEG